MAYEIISTPISEYSGEVIPGGGARSKPARFFRHVSLVPASSSSVSPFVNYDLNDFPKASEPAKIEAPGVGEALYPHLFEQNAESGKVVDNFKESAKLAADLVRSYAEADISFLDQYLTKIGAILAATYKLTEFNPALGGLTSFLRRATLFSDRSMIDISSLTCLQRVLKSVSNNPMISLDAVTDSIIDLEQYYWHGDDDNLVELVNELLLDPEVPESVKSVVEAD